jgi:thiol-disulfide isomerase/thioredoxin
MSKHHSGNKTSYTYIYIAIAIVAAALLGWGILTLNQQSTKLDGFATCIKDSGATFYGAFWCPHCQAQKAEFKKSASKLPYVECSQPDGKTQTQVCIDKGISSYPTWYFKDGSKEEGELSLDKLAEKTGCVIPADAK